MLHTQQALSQMNLLLRIALSASTGVTGQAMVAGERNPARLAAFRASNGTTHVQQIIKALMGTWQSEHRFIVAQALALFDHDRERIAAWDQKLVQLLGTRESRGEPDAP